MYFLQLLGPGCQTKVGILDLYLAMFMVCLSVCESVCLSLVMRMYSGKMAGPSEMQFGMCGGVGHSHHLLDRGPDPPHGNGQFSGGEGAVP